MSFRLNGPGIAFLLILVLTLCAYSNSFDGVYYHDDFHQIVNNPHIRRLGNIPSFFITANQGTYYKWLKGGYRPVTYASFAINYALSGYKLFGYHFFNLALHILNAFLVYLILSIILKESTGDGGSSAPLAASLVFALHPVQTAAVTYVSGRAMLLVSFFCLLSFYSFLRFRTGGRAGWLILSSLSFLIGLLSKEMAVSALLIIAAYEILFTLPGRPAKKTFAPALTYLPFLAAFALYLAARKILLGFSALGKTDYSSWTYLVTQLKVLLIYLRLLVFPVNQNADYGLFGDGTIDARALASFALVALALFLAWRFRKKFAAVSFFILWFFAAHAPESSIFPIRDVAVEYRLYLSSIGFIAAAVLICDRVSFGRSFKKAALTSVVLLLSIITFSRNNVWGSETRLFNDTVKKSPLCVSAHSNLGNAFLNTGRYEDAIRELKLALEMKTPFRDDYVIRRDLGLCYYYTGRFKEASEELKKAIAEQPDEMICYVNLGMVYDASGQKEEAFEILQKAEAADPEFPDSHYYLSKFYSETGDYKASLNEILLALKYSPKSFKIRYALAFIYHKNGMDKESLEQARAAEALAENGRQKQLAEVFIQGLETGGIR